MLIPLMDLVRISVIPATITPMTMSNQLRLPQSKAEEGAIDTLVTVLVQPGQRDERGRWSPPAPPSRPPRLPRPSSRRQQSPWGRPC